MVETQQTLKEPKKPPGAGGGPGTESRTLTPRKPVPSPDPRHHEPCLQLLHPHATPESSLQTRGHV